MKIAIDLTPLYNRRITGVEVYGIELYQALLKTKEEITPIFRKENTLDSNANAVVIDNGNRIIVENLLLSKTLRKLNIDIALFPIFPPPIDIYWGTNFKTIPTIHDLAFLHFNETLSFGAKYYLTPKYKLLLKKASKIITISETVKTELETISNIPILNLGNNISPKYIDIELKIDSAFLNKWNLEKGEYFISVSTVEPRKNFKYLLNVFFELLKLNPSLKLVLVGRKGWGNDNELKMLINKLEKSLIFTDYVSDEELISLYHYSKAFFLLSIYEGFGRTPIEALACGCKNIFVSDIPVFRETMNGQAEFLPLDSIQDCVEIINRHDFSSNKNANLQIPFNILGQNVKENIHTLLK